MKALCAGVFATLAVVLLLVGGQVDGQEKAKYSIKEVMKKAMSKNGLCGKVASGNATAEEKEKLVELFDALHYNTPPKGEAEGWKARTKKLLDAAKAGDPAALKAAADCKGCHAEHKGK